MHQKFIQYPIGQSFTSSRSNDDITYMKIRTIDGHIMAAIILDHSRHNMRGNEVGVPSEDETLTKVYTLI